MGAGYDTQSAEAAAKLSEEHEAATKVLREEVEAAREQLLSCCWSTERTCAPYSQDELAAAYAGLLDSTPFGFAKLLSRAHLLAAVDCSHSSSSCKGEILRAPVCRFILSLNLLVLCVGHGCGFFRCQFTGVQIEIDRRELQTRSREE